MRGVFVRQFGGPETLSVESAPDPTPGADEVVVDIRAVAANFVDLLVIGGTYQFLPPPPFIPGKLPVGIITKLGSNVHDWKAGDRVHRGDIKPAPIRFHPGLKEAGALGAASAGQSG